ncbi:unnamed protein product [Withania somnifera]
MVLSNKKLKQKLRVAKTELLAASEVKINPTKVDDPNSKSLKCLVNSATQKPRLSKRDKRREKALTSQDGQKEQEEVGARVTSEQMKGKHKKRKRDETEGLEKDSGELKHERKPMKKKKKKKKKKGKQIVEDGKVMEGMNVGDGGNGEAAAAAKTSKSEESGFLSKFVFQTEAAAKRAMALDGSDMGGLFLKIQSYKSARANKVSNFSPNMVEGYYRVYVGNLSWNVTEDDLKKLFSDCSINSIRFGEDKLTGEFRGYAHVDFADNLSVNMALKLDQKIVCGRPVRISCAVAKEGAVKKGGATNSRPRLTDQNADRVATSTVSAKIRRRTCYECGERGHLSSSCPKKQETDRTEQVTS